VCKLFGASFDVNLLCVAWWLYAVYVPVSAGVVNLGFGAQHTMSGMLMSLVLLLWLMCIEQCIDTESASSQSINHIFIPSIHHHAAGSPPCMVPPWGHQHTEGQTVTLVKRNSSFV
jgi:hypothetical protein